MVLFTRKVDFLGWQLAIDKKHTAAMLGKRLSVRVFSFTMLPGWQWTAGRLASAPYKGGHCCQPAEPLELPSADQSRCWK